MKRDLVKVINKTLFRRLKEFDPELSELLKISLDRQNRNLSLISTDNAASPFATFLKASALGNDFIGRNAVEHYSRLENLAVTRVCKLFKAESAIVRIGNLIAASRVVFQTFLKPNETVMSFNLRKKEHCSGSQMNYNFINFGVEPDSFKIDFDKVLDLAKTHKPKMIIYSPVNYPYNIPYIKLRNIAASVNAILWIDIGQNAGLIAAALIPTPIPYADIITFTASDALHGAQSGIILSKNKYSELLKKMVVETGHASVKKNIFASLAMTFKEASCDEHINYAEQVIENARALEKGLKISGAEILCEPTENHLVLVRLPENLKELEIVEKLIHAGLLVKSEKLMTSDENISYPVLRLSSLDPTTRSLTAEDMTQVGITLGEFLKSSQDKYSIEKVKNLVNEMVEGLPLFSEEWLPRAENFDDDDTDLIMKTLAHWQI